MILKTLLQILLLFYQTSTKRFPSTIDPKGQLEKFTRSCNGITGFDIICPIVDTLDVTVSNTINTNLNK